MTLFPIPDSPSIYIYAPAIDFRLGINGLSALVQASLQLDPMASSLFVFRNKARNRIKILYWHKNGFCLWMKRLERHKFHWPHHTASCLELSVPLLRLLLDGIDINVTQPHEALYYRRVA